MVLLPALSLIFAHLPGLLSSVQSSPSPSAFAPASFLPQPFSSFSLCAPTLPPAPGSRLCSPQASHSITVFFRKVISLTCRAGSQRDPFSCTSSRSPSSSHDPFLGSPEPTTTPFTSAFAQAGSRAPSLCLWLGASCPHNLSRALSWALFPALLWRCFPLCPFLPLCCPLVTALCPLHLF